jgi:L-lactate dehydrogenase
METYLRYKKKLEIFFNALLFMCSLGQVGMACAFSLLVQGICNELALTDVAEDKLKGELLDLRHGVPFLRNVKIDASKGNSRSILFYDFHVYN